MDMAETNSLNVIEFSDHSQIWCFDNIAIRALVKFQSGMIIQTTNNDIWREEVLSDIEMAPGADFTNMD